MQPRSTTEDGQERVRVAGNCDAVGQIVGHEVLNDSVGVMQQEQELVGRVAELEILDGLVGGLPERGGIQDSRWRSRR